MATLTPTQREAYEAFTDLWQHRGIPRPRAFQIFKDALGYEEIPYFMELSVAECETIKHMLRPDVLLPRLEAIGKDQGICQLCGRTLTDPASIDRGIGPECAKKLTRPVARNLEDLL